MPEDVGRLTPHVTSIALMLSFSRSLPQLPPPAPLWKPPLTEPSSAPSSLSDTRSTSCAPRASNWWAPQHVFAETTAPGAASAPPVKVSVTRGFVDHFYGLESRWKGTLASLRIGASPIYEVYFTGLLGKEFPRKPWKATRQIFFSRSGVTWQQCNASH